MDKENYSDFNKRIIDFFTAIHPLDRIPRAGWLLRGVPYPEDVAAHSHFLALLVMLFLEQYPGKWNAEKVLRMALIHDLPEAFLMDIPLPVSDKLLGETKKNAETELVTNLFKGLAENLTNYFIELQERKTKEARLIAGLDKAQMMIKLLNYEKAGLGNLKEFWENAANFIDYGIKEVAELFKEICRQSGKSLPDN